MRDSAEAKLVWIMLSLLKTFYMTRCTKGNKVLLIGYLLLISVMMYAGDNERKWALSFTGSPFVRPVLTRNLSNHSVRHGFNAFTLTGEYYLPKKWSAEAGYFRTKIDYGGHSRTMEGIQLGMRRYFLNEFFFIKPYVAALTQFNWGQHIEKSYVLYNTYMNSQYTRNPVIIFSPVVGAEFYLLSPVAFVIRYSFNMGIHSKTIIDVLPENKLAYSLQDKGMYQNLELGIKITFPFRFSDNKQRALINMQKESLLH